MDAYTETMVVVEYHLFDEYTTAWGDSRAAFFDTAYGTYTPHMIFDGSIDAGSDPYTFKGFYLDRQQVATDVTIASEVYAAGNWCQVESTVCLESGGTPGTVRVFTVQLLDHYPAQWGYSRNTFQQAAPVHEVDLEAGSCVELASQLTLDAIAASALEQVKIVVWVQEAVDAAPADIRQSVEAAWPFAGAFRDGFESGDTSAWSSATLRP